ncbi:MAG: hypothetical protein NTV34_19450 [Proteobacteria bacterium]|nr:hypothetical protein [Pseudomonadota bacterium]
MKYIYNSVFVSVLGSLVLGSSCSQFTKKQEAASRVTGKEVGKSDSMNGLQITGSEEIAMIRYQIFNANVDGSLGSLIQSPPNTNPNVPNVIVNKGSRLIVRTQMRDLRSVSLPKGVYSAYHNMKISNPDGSADRRLTLDWGEYTQFEIPKTVVLGGTFAIQFASSSTSARTAPIGISFAYGKLDMTVVAASVQAALGSLNSIGPGNVIVYPLPDISTASDYKFGINFTGVKSHTNVTEILSLAPNSNGLKDQYGNPSYPSFLRNTASPLDVNVTSVARKHIAKSLLSGAGYVQTPSGALVERSATQPFDLITGLGGFLSQTSPIATPQEATNFVNIVDTRFDATAVGKVVLSGESTGANAKLGVAVFGDSPVEPSTYLKDSQMILPQAFIEVK